MKLQLNNLSHHSYCLIGGEAEKTALLSTLDSEFGLVKKANQDFFEQSYENFSIDDARALKLIHEMRPVSPAGKKIFIIKTDFINIEAQNALLKLLEEPADYAYFFIIISNVNLLLPTVKSRLHFIEINKSEKIKSDNEDCVAEAKKFISSNPAKRLELVKKFVDEISKEKRTKQDVILLLNEMEKQIRDEKGVIKGEKSLKVIENAIKYLNDRSPSIKMLLEYVALSI
jgi:DNA polymerase III gamma/tau subunit